MSSDKLWTEDLYQLFTSLDIIPTSDMSIESKMNALTRLVILSSLVMALFNPILGIVMFFVCIIVIIAVYSANKEGYEDFPITSKRFCNDAVPIAPNDPDYVSLNQHLVGPANPKTLIPPTIAVPSHDLSVWKENDLVKHSAINAQTNFDLNRSGYTMDTFMPSKCTICNYIPCMCHVSKKINKLSYKDKLLTQTIQPGVYQKSYVGEPINNNIGITFTQPFVPTVVDETPTSIKFTQYNPSDIHRIPSYIASEIPSDDVKITLTPNPHQPVVEQTIEQTQNNVYDPRFTGYGTSYRGYTDELTGQAKFFYKDVDAVIRPNYIVRSNVDVFPWADHYGPDKKNYAADEIRTLANNAFHDSAIKFRTDLQERLMRKRNAEMWQCRAFPKSTQPQI